MNSKFLTVSMPLKTGLWTECSPQATSLLNLGAGILWLKKLLLILSV